MSRGYDLKLTVRETGLADFVRTYQNQEKYLAYCRECDNYDAKWSCPPMVVDTAEYQQGKGCRLADYRLRKVYDLAL